MKVLILGASGKIGKFITDKIINKNILENTKELYLHYNNNPIKTESIPKSIFVKQVRLDLLDMDNIKNFVTLLPSKIDVFINLLSLFEESRFDCDFSIVQKTISINFSNQVLLLREILPKVSGGVIIQFLDTSIQSPYVEKYFWYSVSRRALYNFYKEYIEYATKNKFDQHIAFVFPKMVKTQEELNQITNIFDSIKNTDIRGISVEEFKI
ncbi:MAG: hypothetical protein N2712_04845 [Brevinematales bacterium]|nr:hypothetical protein [Brevinematales bacterium]